MYALCCMSWHLVYALIVSCTSWHLFYTLIVCCRSWHLVYALTVCCTSWHLAKYYRALCIILSQLTLLHSGITQRLLVLGTWCYEYPCCTDRNILFLFLLTNVLVSKSLRKKESAECPKRKCQCEWKNAGSLRIHLNFIRFILLQQVFSQRPSLFHLGS